MARQSFGAPSVTGTTVEEIRRSTQFWLQHLTNTIDELAGVRGTAAFYSDVDMQGRRITHLGTPVDEMDAVPQRDALTKTLDPSTGLAKWNAENLQMLNLQAASRPDQGVNLQQLKDEIAAAGVSLIPYGTIVLWYGSAAAVPGGWRICDGTGGTPDLRDRFVVGTGPTYAQGTTGGAATINLAHSHTADGTLATATPSATETVDNDLAVSTVAVASGTHTHDVTGSTDTQLSATQSILPPYVSLLFIMKV
jgi:hypothetical protein